MDAGTSNSACAQPSFWRVPSISDLPSGEPWLEIESRVIDRYEAKRARGTLEWAELCAARDGEKAEAVARVQAVMPKNKSV